MMAAERLPRVIERLSFLRNERSADTGKTAVEDAREAELEKQGFDPREDFEALKEMVALKGARVDVEEYRKKASMELSGLGVAADKGLADILDDMRKKRAILTRFEAGSPARTYLDFLQDMRQMIMDDYIAKLRDDAAIRALGYFGVMDRQQGDPPVVREFDADLPVFKQVEGEQMVHSINDIGLIMDALLARGTDVRFTVDSAIKDTLLQKNSAGEYQDAYDFARVGFESRAERFVKALHAGEELPPLEFEDSTIFDQYSRRVYESNPAKYDAMKDLGKSMGDDLHPVSSLKELLLPITISGCMENAAEQQKIPAETDFVMTDRQSMSQDAFTAFMNSDMRIHIGDYMRVYQALQGNDLSSVVSALNGGMMDVDLSKTGATEAQLNRIFSSKGLGNARDIMKMAAEFHRSAEFGSRLFDENIRPQFTDREAAELEAAYIDPTDVVTVGGRSLKSYVGGKYDMLPDQLREKMVKAELANVMLNTDLPVGIIHYRMVHDKDGNIVPEAAGITALKRTIQPAFRTKEANDALAGRVSKANDATSLAHARDGARRAQQHPRTSRVRTDIETARTPEEIFNILDACKAADPDTFDARIDQVHYLAFLGRDGAEAEGTKVVAEDGKRVMVIDPDAADSPYERFKEELLAFCDAIDRKPADDITARTFRSQYDREKRSASVARAGHVTVQQMEELNNLYEKMQNEQSPWYHKDSKEYKAMFRAMKEFHEQTEGLDINDPAQRVKIAALMENVYAAADKYADKEAYKDKASELGVSRKNTALAILDTINPFVGTGKESKVSDLRISKDSAAKKPTTFRELMDMERDQNKSAHDARERIRSHQARAHARQQQQGPAQQGSQQ